MQRLNQIIFLTLFGFCSWACAQDAPVKKSASESAINQQPELGFGTSFCIFTVFERGLTGVKATLYTTYGVGDCNDSEYKRLTADSISAQLQTFMKPVGIIKNGLHTLVMSQDLSPAYDPYIEIGKFRFRKAGELTINYLNFAYRYITEPRFRKGLASSSFTPLKVFAEKFYIYNPGLMVYQLHSPDGKTYTMTTFSNLINPSLNSDGLKDLGPSLELPQGWTFSVRVLDKQISVRTNQALDGVENIFDNFGNFYVQTQ